MERGLVWRKGVSIERGLGREEVDLGRAEK